MKLLIDKQTERQADKRRIKREPLKEVKFLRMYNRGILPANTLLACSDRPVKVKVNVDLYSALS